MRNILIIYYYYAQYPPRATISDHLFSFQRYTPYRIFYLNLALRRIPSHLLKVPFDLIIFHTTFLSVRAWAPLNFCQLTEGIKPLKQIDGVKIALPQDEFLNTDLLCDFINEFDIRYIFSVMPHSEWKTIYQKIDHSKTKIFRVLTGYLDERTVARINRLAENKTRRTIDISYRAWEGAPWLGRHGRLKGQIATVFQENAPRKRLRTDISTEEENVLLGDDWYEFLLKSKYTLGVEGGASILDRDGTIKEKTEAYLKDCPQASFEEVEANCFRGLDGSSRLIAISPRHLEACATRTCQVLVEGEFNGILKPGIHYIQLKSDFSNLNEVLEIIKKDTLRAEITEKAYRDIVCSKLYTYRKFVEFVLNHSFQNVKPHASSFWAFWVWKHTKLADFLCWRIIQLRSLFPHSVIKKIPDPLRSVLRINHGAPRKSIATKYEMEDRG